MKKFRWLVLMLVLCAFALSAFACGNGDDDETKQPPAPTQYTVTVVGGVITGTELTSKAYEENTQASVTASVGEGFTFSGWKEGDEIVSTANPYAFQVTKNVTLTAVLEEIPYYDLSETERKDLTNADTASTDPAFTIGLQPEIKQTGSDAALKVTIPASDGENWANVRFDAEEFFGAKVNAEGKFLEVDMLADNAQNWLSIKLGTGTAESVAWMEEKGTDLQGVVSAGFAVAQAGDFYRVTADLSTLYAEADLSGITFVNICVSSNKSDYSKDSVIYLDNLIFTDLPYAETNDLTNDPERTAGQEFSSVSLQGEVKRGGSQALAMTMAADANTGWPHITLDAASYYGAAVDVSESGLLVFDLKIENGKNWFSYFIHTSDTEKTAEKPYDIGSTADGIECSEAGDGWYHIAIDIGLVLPEVKEVHAVELCFTNEGKPSADAATVFYLDNMKFEPVDPAKLIERYEAKDMSNQENAEVGDSSVMSTVMSGEVYSENSNRSRAFTVNAGAAEGAYTVRVLANAYFKDWGQWDASEASVSFDVKAVNLGSLSFWLDPDNGKPSAKIEIPLKDGEKGNGFTVTALENGWYRVEMIFKDCDFENDDFSLSCVKKFNFDLNTAGSDSAQAHMLYLDNVFLEGGKDISA